jgi:hypothetical protein
VCFVHAGVENTSLTWFGVLPACSRSVCYRVQRKYLANPLLEVVHFFFGIVENILHEAIHNASLYKASKKDRQIG